jgi:hypothetical protein
MAVVEDLVDAARRELLVIRQKDIHELAPESPEGLEIVLGQALVREFAETRSNEERPQVGDGFEVLPGLTEGKRTRVDEVGRELDGSFAVMTEIHLTSYLSRVTVRSNP